ncbi:MAG: 50S ribosomal protein L21 [Coxiellaceae bacterium]|jgi:large subunit ribosomal protein L21|nr:50S ribosomal protein L21 [Coxiellaceae bacterium]
MYAIIVTGGKQYKAVPGEVLRIEKIDAEIGSSVEFDKVLMIVMDNDINIGTPYVSGAKVVGEISKQDRGDKVNIIKFRRRKHYMKHQGHRQYFTTVKIGEISNKNA